MSKGSPYDSRSTLEVFHNVQEPIVNIHVVHKPDLNLFNVTESILL